MIKPMILFLFYFVIINISLANELLVVVPPDVLKDYHAFVTNKDVLQIKNFSSKGSRRDVVEVILMQQALHHGGITESIKFYPISSYTRIKMELEKGEMVSVANSMWLSDLETIKDKVYISIPIIKEGEIEAGLYTVPDNTKALSVKTIQDIQNLSAISNKSWTPDWKALTSLNLKNLQSTPTWLSMVRMVDVGRADFLLAPFQSTQDLSFEAEGVRFVAIPEMKVILPGSRHFAISKKHPRGQEVFNAFNKGLQILISRGIVKKAYQQSGFFNIRVSNWKILNGVSHTL